VKVHLIVCPIAVGSSWVKTIMLAMANMTTLWGHQKRGAREVACTAYTWLVVKMGGGKSLTLLAGLGLLGKKIEYVNLCNRRWSTKRKAKELQAMIDQAPSDLVIIVNYDAFRTVNDLSKMIQKLPLASINLDESQRIKAPRSKAGSYLKRLAKSNPSAKRTLLTGTPMPHSPFDLWNQLQFLDPSIYPHSFGVWRSTVALLHPELRFPLKWINQEIPRDIMAKHSFQPSEEEYIELPDCVVSSIECEMNPTAAKVYKSLSDDMMARIKEGVITAANAAVRTTRLRQCVAGHAKIEEPECVVRIGDKTPDKMIALQDFLEDVSPTEPIVVFAELRSEMEEIKTLADKLERPYAEVSGAVPSDAKSLEEWQDGDATIIGVQHRAGGEGIDLSRASLGFYYSSPWSLGLYEQTLKRLHRPGQKNHCRIYHLICRNTIDQKVVRALRDQKNVVDFILKGED
jgi:SNF2 family DNA or RNA helicase